MIYIYSWGPRFRVPDMPVLDRKGERCRLLCRGQMNSALVEFMDGERYVISRNALRRESGAGRSSEKRLPHAGGREPE